MDDLVLTRTEQAVFGLRKLYRQEGFSAYKMSRFEEYDLYLQNKDFLQSQQIITFADQNGRLLAMKPDVTLSIIKNTVSTPGMVQKLYYNENVYRTDKATGCYREILQSGVECVGDLHQADIAQVMVLAAKSLQQLGKSFVLDISHMGLLSALLTELGLPGREGTAVLGFFQKRNGPGLEAFLEEKGIAKEKRQLAADCLGCCGKPEAALQGLKKLLDVPALQELEELCGALKAAGFEEAVRIDLSVSNDMQYYSGVVLRGYLAGITDPILAGGQYDRLLRGMGKTGRAIGFAVNVQLLEQPAKPNSDLLNIALPKGRLGEKAYAILKQAGYGCPALEEGGRKLVFESRENGVRYFWVKPSDVSIYVERGAADLGIVGKDILLEYRPDVYELLDLKLGICRMAVAGKPGSDAPGKTLRVATKFPGIAANHFAKQCRDIDIIHLNGSIELAPIVGLSDVIVDIVETGKTLKENGLDVLENVAPISARLIAAPAAWQFRQAGLQTLVRRLEECLK